ncbi:unnamed protein product, partial [Urochloa humidicola]
ENDEARHLLGDLTNTTGEGNKNTFQREDENTDWLCKNGRSTLDDLTDTSLEQSPSTHVDGPDSHRKASARTRQAARRAQMTQEQKDEINRKRRETRLQNKIKTANRQSSYKENNKPGSSTMGAVDNDVVLTVTEASNDNTSGCNPSIRMDDPRKKKTAIIRQAARRAQMSQEQKDESNRKRRERRLQNKGNNLGCCYSNFFKDSR